MKEVFKTIIRDFHLSLPKKDVKKRELQVPLNSGKIITIIGPRRCGKTYYSYQLINKLFDKVEKEKIIYINFEDERLDITSAQLHLIIDAYFELYPGNYGKKIYIFFDEIQEIKGWEKFVRRIYDNITRNIFITGSSSKMLQKEIAASLRGRNIVYNLYQLSFREYCNFQKIETQDVHSTPAKAVLKSQFDRYIWDGSYPETVAMEQDLIARTLQSYYDVMLFRDIVERHEVANVFVLKQFLRKVMNNTSSSFSVNKFYNELKSQGIKISKNSIYEFLDYSLDCFLFFIVNPYDPSIIKQQSQTKKVYAVDTGLVNAVTYRFSHDMGKLLENIVFLHLNRQEKTIYFLKNKYECDFVVIEKMSPIAAIQSCLTLEDKKTKEREIRGLMNALNRLNLSEGFIITMDEEEDLIIEDKKIFVRPCWKWLLSDIQ